MKKGKNEGVHGIGKEGRVKDGRRKFGEKMGSVRKTELTCKKIALLQSPEQILSFGGQSPSNFVQKESTWVQ